MLTNVNFNPLSMIFRSECPEIGAPGVELCHVFVNVFFDIKKGVSRNGCSESRVVFSFYLCECLPLSLAFKNKCHEIGALRLKMCQTLINLDVCHVFDIQMGMSRNRCSRIEMGQVFISVVFDVRKRLF